MSWWYDWYMWIENNRILQQQGKLGVDVNNKTQTYNNNPNGTGKFRFNNVPYMGGKKNKRRATRRMRRRTSKKCRMNRT